MEFSVINFDDSYELIDFEESLRLKNCRQCAHCCIYSSKPFNECKACISMQMRFDGCFGFPGGVVDENVVDGLNRELVEETNLDKKYFISMENYCFTYWHKERNYCLHFFSKEVSLEDILEIEQNSLKAADFGKEVLGCIRVPLFTTRDTIGGFPKFLLNKFAGCAKQQLLYLLLNKKLVSFDYVKESLSKSQ